MRIVIVSVALVVVVAGCGGGGPSCKEAVGEAAKRFGTEERPEVTMLIGKCEQDSWKASVRACLAGAESGDKLEGCFPAPDYKQALPPVEPSDATKQLVAKAGKEPVKALLFFEPDNEVAPIVRTYFQHLGVATEDHDPLVASELAKKYKVYKQGQIVLVRGERSYTVEVDSELMRAIESRRLARFDQDVAGQLARLVRPVPRAYVIAGHGEITDPDSRPPEMVGRIPERRTTMLNRKLVEYGWQVQPLGVPELAKDVPADATVVLWLGPLVEPSTEEWAAVARYVDRGGHLLIALDPTSSVGLGPLEGKLGVRFVADHLADDKTFLPQRKLPTDHAFIITNKFLAHPSTTMLTRAVDKGLVLIDTGRLERLASPAAGLKVTPTIQTRESTFVDSNRNYTFDGDEKRGVFDLGVAVEHDTLRAAVFADVDLFADVLVNGGTGAVQVTMLSGPLFDDTVRWLGGLDDVAMADVIGSKEDPPKADRDALAEIERRRALRSMVRHLAEKRSP